MKLQGEKSQCPGLTPDDNLQLPRGGAHNPPPVTTPRLSLLQAGCDSHSFAAAELVVMGSCTSGSARSKTSFSLRWSF